MKKFKKIFVLLILIATTFVIASCETSNSLKAPDVTNLRIEENVLKWDYAREDALSYIVSFKANDKEYNMVVDNQNYYDFSKFKDELKIVFVVYTSAFKEFGQDSLGTSITYKNPNSYKAPAPTNLRVTDYIFSFDSAVENETLQYIITLDIDGEKKEVTYLGENYNFSIYKNAKKIIFTVSTKAFDDYTLNSDPVTFTYVNNGSIISSIAPTPTNLKIKDYVLSWDDVATNKVINYKVTIDINGSKQTIEVNENKYDFSKYSSLSKISFSVVTVAYDNYTIDSNPALISFSNQDIDIYNETYYLDVLNLSGSALKSSLRTLITSTHKKKTTYDDCKKYASITDADPDKSGYFISFYTGKSMKATWDGGTTWNREHVWCQSLGWFSTSGAGADLHHIRPLESSVNSSRGNKKFGNSGSYYLPYNINGCGLDYRGDVARIIFYLMVRYTEADSYNATAIASSMELLLEWNRLDPVDELELARNDAIQSIQGNRNPFIDCAEFADLIW